MTKTYRPLHLKWQKICTTTMYSEPPRPPGMKWALKGSLEEEGQVSGLEPAGGVVPIFNRIWAS